MRLKILLTFIFLSILLIGYAQRVPRNQLALEDSVKTLIIKFGQVADLNIRKLPSGEIVPQSRELPPNQEGKDYFRSFFSKEDPSNVKIFNFIFPGSDFNEYFPGDLKGWTTMASEPGMIMSPEQYLSWFSDTLRQFTRSLSGVKEMNIIPSRWEYKSSLNRKYTVVYAKIEFQGGYEYIDENKARQNTSVVKNKPNYYLQFKISYEYLFDKLAKKHLPTDFLIDEINIRPPDETGTKGDSILTHIIYKPKFRSYLEILPFNGISSPAITNHDFVSKQGSFYGIAVNYIQLYNLYNDRKAHYGFKTGLDYSMVSFSIQSNEYADAPIENVKLLPFEQTLPTWVESYTLIKSLSKVNQENSLGIMGIPVEFYSTVRSRKTSLFYGAGFEINFPVSRVIKISQNQGSLVYIGNIRFKTPDNQLSQISLTENYNDFKFGEFDQSMKMSQSAADLKSLFVSAKLEAGIKYSLFDRTVLSLGIGYKHSLTNILNKNKDTVSLIGNNTGSEAGEIKDFLLANEKLDLSQLYIHAGISVLIFREKKIKEPLRNEK
jgi:hypothetical protein